MKFKMLLVSCLICVAALLCGAESGAKYVFFFIGDGMSVPQRKFGDEISKLARGRDMLINSMPINTLTSTHSANAFVTDSAASGTANACGEKVLNYALGVSPDGRKLESCATLAARNGRKVGILTSVPVNHATPAAFYAHVPKRDMYYRIARQMLESGFDFLGGSTVLDPDGKNDKTADGNIYNLAAAKFTVVRDVENLKKLRPGSGKPVLALLPQLEKYVVEQGGGDGSELALMTAKAVELLDNPKGFFIMVEGGKIDYAAHVNDGGAMGRELLAFDDAVKVAMDFAAKHPDDTLIVITGDHETGGAAIGFGGDFRIFLAQTGSIGEFRKSFSAMKKSNKNVTFEDAEVLIKKYFGFGWNKFSAADRKKLELALAYSIGRKPMDDTCLLLGGSNDPFVGELFKTVGRMGGVCWTSSGHSALFVYTSAWGRGAEAFADARDNTLVGRKLKDAVK